MFSLLCFCEGFIELMDNYRYTESIEILYKKNRFNFDRFEDVLKLSLTLVPERMQWMRDIQWREHTNLFSWSSTGTYQLSHM